MPFSSESLLQFGELKELLAKYAGSIAGRSLVLELVPRRDRAALEADLAEASEAIGYLREVSGAQEPSHGAAIRLRFDQLRDIALSLRTLRVEGASLDGRQILDLFHTLALAGEYRGILLSVSNRYPRLAHRGGSLADLRGISRRYQRAFLPDGSLADEASVTLGRIRREIERQQRNIQDSLARFMRAHRDDGTLQEDFVTIREDRYVVPIVAGQKGRVDGVIHGASGTGRTLFVEPLDTIELNNQLVRLREDELREIDRILAEITDALREHSPEIMASADTLAEFDCIFAKAGFAHDYEAAIPRFSDTPRKLRLREARHPLLETVLRKQRKPIIPISFELDEDRHCLLISGPNTGGKTVTLKTAGLLAVMAHAAIPVPCAEAEFPLLEDVLADIGDTQSIAESLSSFSGHLLHVKEMLARVTPDTLVLLDELGRATDPEEGGALGVAVLDQFRQSGAFCLASTHLLPLKLYGANTPGVLNGSMGFNEATLQPTYELRLGMPGKSAGLDIATRLEMPEPVLTHARQVLPRIQADFQELLAELHRQVDENAQRARQMEEATRRLSKRQAEVEREAAQHEQQRQSEWEKKSESIIADFEARAQIAMDRLAEAAEQRKAAEQAQRILAKTKREFREEAAEAITLASAKGAAAERLPIEEGATVRLRDVREPATVRRLLKNGMFEVEAGFLKMQVPGEDILEVVPATAKSRLPKNVRFDAGPSWNLLQRELNIIGQRAEEAVEHVDKFLDSAALASVNRVRIVHGHGMGVLKKAVGEFLASSPHVSRFYPATQSEGGAGATIVELRE
ncbi:MAG: Smr/MutS family protein [Acidobacteriaceae bacterium]|nr:Smr/MutS family protein [Acidobacteriaceae bacterium]MBV9779451.1 Smr/MutS family protein [Acidobacteriaceae bacterium]